LPKRQIISHLDIPESLPDTLLLIVNRAICFRRLTVFVLEADAPIRDAWLREKQLNHILAVDGMHICIAEGGQASATTDAKHAFVLGVHGSLVGVGYGVWFVLRCIVPHHLPYDAVHAVGADDNVAFLVGSISQIDFDAGISVLDTVDTSVCADERFVWKAVV
jgi:hypothetical protein